MTNPLHGVRVVELAGIGPGPHAAMLLADLGADVVRVCRRGSDEAEHGGREHTLRGRSRVYADLKEDRDREAILRLVEHADVLIEGFRPGVAERLGIGPAECREKNAKLVYARMTGWGQSGPFATMAGHDINYISLTGALFAVGPSDRPVPPLNLVGDYGGGSLFLVAGILAALVDAARSGHGRVIDAAMVDGVSALLQPIWELRASGQWTDEREANLLDGGAPFYRTYRCADEEFVAVGAIEPQFYSLLVAGLGLSEAELPPQMDRSSWPLTSQIFAERFAARSRDAWADQFAMTDACVTPVLRFDEVGEHPHMRARKILVGDASRLTASPAPRLGQDGPPSSTEADLESVFVRWAGMDQGRSIA